MMIQNPQPGADPTIAPSLRARPRLDVLKLNRPNWARMKIAGAVKTLPPSEMQPIHDKYDWLTRGYTEIYHNHAFVYLNYQTHWLLLN
jgi:hypothetical protein